MSKFKVGDLAWSPRYGFAKIAFVRGLFNYPIKTEMGEHFLCDGRQHENDFSPTLLTVEEAAKLGHYPPKKKVTKTFYTGAFRDASGKPALVYDLHESRQAAEAVYCDSYLYNLGIATVTIEVEE